MGHQTNHFISPSGMIISEASRRICATRAQQSAKPGRQIITFMLFANITLWVLDTFMSHRDITQGVQTQFYGLLAWGIISRISLPLLIFYRFHSCVVLVEIWKNTYRYEISVTQINSNILFYCTNIYSVFIFGQNLSYEMQLTIVIM